MVGGGVDCPIIKGNFGLVMGQSNVMNGEFVMNVDETRCQNVLY